MRGAPLPARQDLGTALEQHPGLQLQIAEVHRVHRAHPILIEPINLRHRGARARGALAAHASGEMASFLACSIRARASFERRRIGQRRVFEHAANHRHRIAFVEDREVAIVAERVALPGAEFARTRNGRC